MRSFAAGRRVHAALVALTALLLAVAAVSGYVRAEIVDSDAFARRVTSSLDDRRVRQVVAERLTTAILRNVAVEAIIVRPVAVTGVAAVTDTRRFRRLLERTMRARHAALIAGEERFVLSVVPDDRLLVDLVRGALQRLSDRLPVDLRLPVVSLDPRGFELRAARGLQGFAGWWWPLLAGALACAAATALGARSVRDGLAGLGIAVAGAGLLTAVLVFGLGEFVASHASSAADLEEDTERPAVAALWAGLFGDLRTAGLVAAVGGTAVAMVASGAPARRLADGADWLRAAATSTHPAARRLRAAGLLVLGACLLLQPSLALRVATVLAGLALALLGVVRLAGQTGRRPPSPGQPAPGRASPLLLGGAVLATAALTAAAMAAVLPAPAGAPADEAARTGACNGSPALCDRRLDQVVLPATHNSYAAADRPGWFFGSQEHGIARQLRDGIRGFLLDVHFGVVDRANGRVRTDLRYENSSRTKVEDELSPEALRVADRLVGRVGADGLEGLGPRGVYLCHTLCELGAEPLVDQLALLRTFLATRPREVVVLFVEPYVPPAEIERAFRDAGLLDDVATLPADGPMPTLGELITSRRRLVVLAEQGGGEPPWYLEGFELVQDTPLGATRPTELRCDRFRGRPDSPLLLVNHWIPPFPPSVARNAAIGGDVLERRLRRCGRLRGRVPTLAAVDFYVRSGVVDVAARLNAEGP